MIFNETTLKSVFLIDMEPYVDERGRFSRIFCREENTSNGMDMNVVQVNRSMNVQAGTVRGLHYQIQPALESKRVACIRGSIYDIVLDIRKDSQTFLQWIGVTLSAANMKMLHIPMGCAHGFQTLEPDTEILYLHSTCYDPEYYRGIRFDDPRVKVELPLTVSSISDRDANFPLMDSKFEGIQ